MKLEVANVTGENLERGIKVIADTAAEADLLVGYIKSGTTDPEWAVNNLVYSALVKALGLLGWRDPLIQRESDIAIIIRQPAHVAAKTTV